MFFLFVTWGKLPKVWVLNDPQFWTMQGSTQQLNMFVVPCVEPTSPSRIFSVNPQLTSVTFSVAAPAPHSNGQPIVFDFFKVSISLGNNLPFKEEFIPADVAEHTFRDLLPSTEYTLSAAAVSGTGEGAQTSEPITNVFSTRKFLLKYCLPKGSALCSPFWSSGFVISLTPVLKGIDTQIDGNGHCTLS